MTIDTAGMAFTFDHVYYGLGKFYLSRTRKLQPYPSVSVRYTIDSEPFLHYP